MSREEKYWENDIPAMRDQFNDCLCAIQAFRSVRVTRDRTTSLVLLFIDSQPNAP